MSRLSDSYLSSFDITRLKKAKLWSMIFIVVFVLIIIIMVGRPKTPRFIKKVDQNLIQVKAHRDDFQRWALAYETEMASLKKGEEQVGSKLRQAHIKINQLSQHIVEQEKLYRDLLSRFKGVTEHLRSDWHKSEVSLKKTLDKKVKLLPHPVFATSIPAFTTKFVSAPLKSLSKTMPGSKESNKTHLGWLPVGSFFKATLLNGIDAGTGTHAQANPQPVLMRVDSQAFLPNEARYRLHACFVLGSAYGSLPSQRALVRTVRISCVSKDGKAIIDTALQGYVVDLDGKMGLRGQLINRQGAKLAKAMLAGFFGGLSNVVTQFRQVMTQQADGTISRITPQASLALAGVSGADNVTKELMNFYINEAKRLFPVIEVNAGREVVINVSHGLALKWEPVA